MLRFVSAMIAAALLAACASTPQYLPASASDAEGYSHTQIEQNRFFVTYRAPGGADPRLIEDYVLLRAAELTIEQQGDWFIIDRRATDASDARRSGPSIGVGVGGGSFGRHSGGSVGVGMSFPLGGTGARASAATLEIRMGQGEKPDDPNAYDARAVGASLRPRVAAGR